MYYQLPITIMVIGLASCFPLNAGEDITRSPETTTAIEYHFSASDSALLDEVQHACFQYFWKEVGSPALLVRDRKKAPVSSIAAVGFQLSSLPIGVERGWITRKQGADRAHTILKSLIERDDNRKFGVFLHYPDLNTGGLSHEGFEVLASTVDHALFLAGAVTAAQYFHGPLDALVDRLIAETNWRAYVDKSNGLLTMGWTPDDKNILSGPGRFHKFHWWLATDEERLTYFFAVGAPVARYALSPEKYYSLQRKIKNHKDMPPYVVSWPGALFTYFFSHCWIDYRSLGLDDPGRFNIDAPRVDWFENSRRAVLTHRVRCIEQSNKYKTFAPDRWGLSACAARDGYLVPEVQPNVRGQDNWGEGTVAPYAAATAIMFTPRESLAALRAYRNLKDADGQLVVWRDPTKEGYGFVDSFNLDQKYSSDDYVSIDHGPMLLGIENARTGLIWRLFMQHEAVRRSLTRLHLREK